MSRPLPLRILRDAVPQGTFSSRKRAGLQRSASLRSVDHALGDQALGRFENRLSGTLASAHAAGEQLGLLVVHVGAVAEMDDNHGLGAGDRLSRTLADLLSTRVLRRGDALERIARDQFACVLNPITSVDMCLLAANRVRSVMEQGLPVDGTLVRGDASVGIAVSTTEAIDARQFIRRARRALVEARSRRDRIAAFTARRESPLDDCYLLYVDRLHTAIDQNQLVLHFQPQIDVRQGHVVGAEALLRWNDPVLGFVPPNLITEVAERAGLIDKLTMWVIGAGVQACARLRAIAPSVSVSVNISPSNLLEPDLPWYVDRALRTWGVPGSSLMIEITETAMMTERQTAHEALRQLKQFGVRLSVDDFGTGYSSMQYLAELPLDELKIDLIFVKTMLEQPQNMKIVRSMIELAHSLDLDSVAEGVETQAILDTLGKFGCDIAQGYHVAKPMPLEAMEASLRAGPSGRSNGA